jgi:hypothetical protein
MELDAVSITSLFGVRRPAVALLQHYLIKSPAVTKRAVALQRVDATCYFNPTSTKLLVTPCTVILTLMSCGGVI